jgi:ATP-dependent helicase/nuclease subunit A
VAQAHALLGRVREAQQQHEAWLHQQRMARLVRGLINDYAALKRERGWIDMSDLERAALVLMSDPVLSGWVQERLDARVRHLLIDEFQDTNPLQWQALNAWISGYAGAGSAPSVFIVGDPKQSIYRFRRAEPQVFQAAKAFVRDALGGDVLSCDHTRRNAPEVIALVNTVMRDAQANRQFDGFRAHTTDATARGQVFKLPQIAREASAKDDGNVPTAWRDSLTTPRFEVEENRKTLECRQAARWLAQQLRGTGATLRPGQVMVLARKRERLGLMQAELASLHISAQQPEKTDLCDTPEVKDIVALLDVLSSPRHDLSLARVLKSPLFGVQDHDLVQLVLHQRTLRDALVQEQVAAPHDEKPVVTWLQALQADSGLPPVFAGLGARLMAWKSWLEVRPPHDALHAIYQDGDVLARYAAAAPAERCTAVLANLRALLTAVLSIDGGRYTTVYALVRALRAGGIAAPVQAEADAVRLLTVHGAKGLEAPLVLLLDTDGEPLKSETMGVLVDWPGEAAHPMRFVFLASEAQPPACVADALATEQVARNREELNGLYVAMTRTQQTLVLSSMAPRVQNPGSWWTRLQAHAQDAPSSDGPDLTSMASLDPAATPDVASGNVAIQVLPVRTAVAQPTARAAGSTVISNAVQSDHPAEASVESRIGSAMHLLLEWVAVRPGGPVLQNCWNAGQIARVAAQFLLDSEQVLAACNMARGILGGEAAWAWDADELDWHGNEVPIVHRGRMLRIDRLVRRKTLGQWWVLDYKSSAQPHLQPALCSQLQTYREAVGLAHADTTVQAAFLTPQGALLPIENS